MTAVIKNIIARCVNIEIVYKKQKLIVSHMVNDTEIVP